MNEVTISRELLERILTKMNIVWQQTDEMVELRSALSAPVQQQEPDGVVEVIDRAIHVALRAPLTAGTKLYAHPAPADAALVEALEGIVKFGHGNGRGSGWTCANIAEKALAAYKGEKK